MLLLTSKGVPWRIAARMDDETRWGWVVRAIEQDGYQVFDWDAQAFRKKESDR